MALFFNYPIDGSANTTALRLAFTAHTERGELMGSIEILPGGSVEAPFGGQLNLLKSIETVFQLTLMTFALLKSNANFKRDIDAVCYCFC